MINDDSTEDTIEDTTHNDLKVMILEILLLTMLIIKMFNWILYGFLNFL